ncbi:MAG TPA: tRNA (N(6)-L-threonylcarbamoyladenosine(37)-C(2))-methylthiotransferase [Candidatus Nanopelagicaceae bacterium]|nr:tRNA (N(6)-L-threonylcarbamoyladenosine(37)-C(2))-methylthiotransferase [Candidatus Nanopelagicaceae bacterium]
MEKNSFYIETYGCTSNKSDSYIISSVLNKSGYVSSTIEDAEFVIINTCAVKQQTENKIKSRLSELYNRFKSETNKHFIIAGCLPHIEPKYLDIVKNLIPNFSAIIGLDNLNDISLIFEEIKSGKTNLIYKSKDSIDKSEFLINYPKGKITGIVPISEGCLGSCTYCCVKNARGKLFCYNPDNILDNVEHQLKQGIKQIYLTSQDCSVYQYDNINLGDLVRNIVNLDYKFFLRIGMINPSFLVKNFDQLISIFKHEKVYQFLHVPIQSGSDVILKKMKRTYKITKVLESLKILREKVPNLTISTDIICGFPGESEEEFDETIKLIEWLKPEILNISKYTPRPGTLAKNMDQVDSRVIKERSIRLSKIFRASLDKINQEWIGWIGDVIILHEGFKPNQVFGRNFAYKNVFIDDFDGEIAKFIQVKIEKVEGFNLFGK